MRNIEQPVTVSEDGPMGGTKTTHPAFGQVSVSRCSGGNTALYGSDFVHHNYVTLTIEGSELHRTLSNDWHFARKQIVEIALSEAQWATLVSSFNVGGGVPCTLQWVRDVGAIPGLPVPVNRSEQFSAEMKEDFEDALRSIDDLVEAITANTAGVSKKKQEELLSKAHAAKKSLSSSAPFVADQFSEHMENEMERAKVEIHGYATSLFMRAGVESLAGPPPAPVTLHLNHEKENPEC